MNLKKIIAINDEIKRVLPKTYQRPKLLLCEDEQHLLNVQAMKQQVFAVYDPNTDSIVIPVKDTIELSDVDVAKLLLHEYGHARAAQRYGFNSKEYHNEVSADKFACRWVKRLVGIIGHIDNKRFNGWHEEEIQYLKANYPAESKEKIMERLGRSWSAIQSKARLIGVRRR